MPSFDYTYILFICLIFVVYKVLDRLIRWPHIPRRTSRCVLITGCDTGFGHEFAKRLDRIQCTVFAGCLTQQGETLLKKQCSHKLKTLRLDVSNPESVKQAYGFVKESLPDGEGRTNNHNYYDRLIFC